MILLDNMPPKEIEVAIRMIRKYSPKIAIEISGGISLKNVRAMALLGPDRISIGRLTHSAPALDMSLEIQ
jgi:nicotinate-nucleotide pyrophosphorylase (carboxylating)